MSQKRILCPTTTPYASWRPFLSNPETHWKPGKSAMSVAYSWETAAGLPNEIESLFKQSDETALQDIELALAIPEYKVNIPGGNRPSQNDVFALLRCPGGLISVMIEGKCREGFDERLGAWKKKRSRHGVEERLSAIVKHLGITTFPDTIRYQLLHRTASAVIEAKRFHAAYAVMIVQSFEPDDQRNHYQDFSAFLQRYGKPATKGRLIELASINGCRLFAAWACSAPQKRQWVELRQISHAR